MFGDLGDAGERPSCWMSSDCACATSACSFWIGRGGRTIQPKSRNCRLTSPFMVTTAYERNSTPWLGSKFRAALSNAIAAAWVRSSSAMPRPR